MRRWLAGGLAAVVVLGGGLAGWWAHSHTSQAAGGVRWGMWLPAWQSGGGTNNAAVTAAESDLKHPVDIVHWFADPSEGYASYDHVMVDSALAMGKTPLVSWGIPLGFSGNAVLDDWAKGMAAKAPAEIDVRLFWEFNDPPSNSTAATWGVCQSSRTPAQLVASWRSIVDRFRADGATNVKWVWNPDGTVGTQMYAGQCGSLGAAYPGDAYVDYRGFDSYGYDNQAQYDRQNAQVGSQKPMLLAEMGAEQGGDNAAWVDDLSKRLNDGSMSQVAGLVWFDEGKYGFTANPNQHVAVRNMLATPAFAKAAPQEASAPRTNPPTSPSPAAMGCSSPSPSSSASTTPQPPPPAAPASQASRVVVVIFENRSRGQIIGQAPWLTSLAQQGAQAGGYRAVSHPSLPNYLALTFGDTLGVKDDGTGYRFDQRSIVNLLEEAGVSWGAYMEDMQAGQPRQDTGGYAQKHNPFAYMNPVLNTPGLLAKVRPLSQMDAASLPRFVWITPNLTNDMHDGSVQQGDDWARQHLQPLVQLPNTLLVAVWDEDDGSGDNSVAAIFAGPLAKPGASSPAAYGHYSLLRTVEAVLGLGSLGAREAGAPVMADMLAASPSASPSAPACSTPPPSASPSATPSASPPAPRAGGSAAPAPIPTPSADAGDAGDDDDE